MKVLIISDTPEKKYWDYYTEGCLKEFDLIISCGDLPPQYLSFLVTFTNKPLLYVHGNHDDVYDTTPPDGCISIDGDIYVHEGIRFLGLGGSMRYKDGPYMYTEKEMRGRVRKLWWKLRKHKGFDILVTHSPAKGLNDDTDIPHQGFQIFNELMDRYNPKYFLHGHVHMNYNFKLPRVCTYKETTVINGFKSYILEIEKEA